MKKVLPADLKWFILLNPSQCDTLMEAAQKDVEKSWKFLQSRFKALERA